MLWIPFTVSAVAFVLLLGSWATFSYHVRQARKNINVRILVHGSRGKSGTVRLLAAMLSGAGIPSYAKVTGTVAQEIHPDGTAHPTVRLGPISANEMGHSLIRAYRHAAQAIVLECMAVAPKLVWFVQNRIVQAPILVIPTIRLDHLEDEGWSLSEIVTNLFARLEHVKVIVTGETSQEALDAMHAWCAAHDVQLISVKADAHTPPIAGHHPTNVATALAIAHLLGINTTDAVAGMQSTSSEPQAELGWQINVGKEILRFSDLGNANDPQSTAEAVAHARDFAVDKTIVPILVNRWDRPLRIIAFSNAVQPTKNSPRVGIIGGAIPQVRRALRRQGWRRDQIRHIGWRSTLTHSLAIHKLVTLKTTRENAWFVMLENVHLFPAMRILSAMTNRGTVLTNGHTPLFDDTAQTKGLKVQERGSKARGAKS